MRYEYKEIRSADYRSSNALDQALNDAGRLGWEAYATVPLNKDSYKVLLKRLVSGAKRG